MSPRCLALRHVAFEGLGVLERLLPELGFEFHYHDIGDGPLPAEDIESCELLVALGGPIGVYEVEAYPWLVEETSAIGERLRAKKPTLGVCLGAQLMAASLGARVGPGPTKEIGYAPLSLTPTGLASALAPFADQPVLHWHGDNFDLPRGSVRLAFTECCPNQAFALEHYGLGLQFHVEVEPDKLESWLIGHTVELSKAGVRPATLRKQAAQFGEETARRGHEALAKWLEGAFI
ncbi:MAG TPA: glutamine amidotransferase [Rhodoblastus sp.]|nr:glutamine amidotransferase [Rhodoblastus sp.]